MEKVESLRSLNEFVTVDEFHAAGRASYAVRAGTLTISKRFDLAEHAEMLATEVRKQLAERERQVWAEAASIAEGFDGNCNYDVACLVNQRIATALRARGEQVK